MSGVRFAEDADPAGLEFDQNQGSKSTIIVILLYVQEVVTQFT